MKIKREVLDLEKREFLMAWINEWSQQEMQMFENENKDKHQERKEDDTSR